MRLHPSDIFFTRGSTEGISLAIAHLGEIGHGLGLPL